PADAGHPPPMDAGTSTDAGNVDAGEPDAGLDAGFDAGVPLSWGPCDTTGWPDEYPMAPAGLQCARVSVPLDHAQPASGSFTLRVARTLSTSGSGKALFQLAGGPGGSAIWESGVIPLVFPDLVSEFDVIYMDQRGTGGSGYLDCSAGYPETQADWTACAAEHTTEPLGHYLTADAAEDVESVRQQLGYAKIYVHGGSYGTRVGLEYARLYPQNLVAAVLDGVLPPDVDDFAHDLVQQDSAVQKLIADCNADAACLAVSPTLEADLNARKQTLATTPRPITVQGQAYTEDDQLFEDALYGALDWTGTYYRVPKAIHASVGGDNTLWNGVLTDVFGVTVSGASDPTRHHPHRRPRLVPLRHPELRGLSYVAPGLFEAVTCAEYLPNATMANLQLLSTQQSWLYESADELGRSTACAAWNVSAAPASVRAAVSSDAKVLLMSGEIDFRTPAAWGAQAKQTLPHATHVVFPYASHEAGTVYECAAKMTAQYLAADGDYSQVDATCMQALKSPGW
ncbi:MAG TPA: alpha/beta fold hydrolase, partial [Dongiaceae bacterium]|nr:alpha/beta fold hydrolase [Dongiaceae bacterium]